MNTWENIVAGTIQFNDGAGNAMLTALVAYIDALTGPTIDIYSASGGTKLASFALPRPCGTVEANTLTFATLPDATGLAAGTGTFFMLHVPSGVTVLTGPASLAGAGGIMELSKAEIAQGDVIKLLAASLIMPS